MKKLLLLILLTGCTPKATVQCISDTKSVYWQKFSKVPYVGQVGYLNGGGIHWCIEKDPIVEKLHWCDIKIKGDNVNCITTVFNE